MATVIPYLSGGESITPARMNTLFGALDGRMDTMFGGRSFLMAFKPTSVGSSNQSEEVWGHVPYEVLGKCFFFLDGAVYYSRSLPGFVIKTVTVPDPTTGGTASTTGGYSYDESFFDSVPVTPAIYDGDEATIADVAAGVYPPWIRKFNGVSIFEHSLKCHTAMLQGPNDTEPREYFLKEQSCPIPTKRYELALAEIIIEGKTEISIPSDWDKFKCFRFHNLQPRQCQVNLWGTSLTLEAFECQTWRNGERSPMRYFVEFKDNDPRHFWFHPRLPDGTNYFRVVTSASACQGNNVCNPTVIYDFIKRLTQRNVNVANNPTYAFFERDPSVNVCDIYNLIPEYRKKFGKPGATEAHIDYSWVLGDFLHHRGKFTIATTPFPTNASAVTTFTEGEFPGYQPVSNLISYMATLGITVTESGGLLNFKNTDATKRKEIVQHGTNFLKSFEETRAWATQTGRNIDGAGYTLENHVFEAHPSPNVIIQFPGGDNFPFLAASSGYRIAQRTVASTARTSPQWKDVDGVFHTIPGAPLRQISEAFGIPAAMTGIHSVSLSQLLSLKYFGNGGLSTQNDQYVEFANPQITFTPFGLWLTFEERVTADIIPDLFAVDSLVRTWYYNTRENRLRYDAASDKFILRHCVRFRRHGWPFSEHGRDYAGFFGPIDGRIAVQGYKNDVSGKDGKDHTVIRQKARRTGADILRQIDVSELGITQQGERFLTSPKPTGTPPFTQFDALIEFLNSKSSSWYFANRHRLITGSTDAQSRGPTIAMPLSAVHYNGMAMVVNQLTECKPLDYKAFVFIVGAQKLSFDPSPATFGFATGEATGLPGWGMAGPFGIAAPSPMDALSNLTGVPYLAYWKHLFQTLGVSVRNVANFPDSFHTYKTLKTETRRPFTMMSGSVSNATFGGTRKIYEGATESTAFWFIYFNGRVTLNLTDWEWGPVTVGAAGGVGVLGQFGLNLNTAYTNVEWVAISDVKQAFASRGIPWHYSDVFLPLEIITYKVSDELLRHPLSRNSVTYEGEIASCDSNLRYINAPNDPPTASHGVSVAGITRLNALVVPPTKLDWPSALTTKEYWFVLSAGSDAQWKLGANFGGGPPTLYDKTEVAGNRAPSLQFNTMRLWKHIRGYQELLGRASEAFLNIEQPGSQNVRPWHPADFFTAVPNTTPGSPGSSPSTPWGNPNFSQPGYVRWCKQDGPRVFADLQIETGKEAYYNERYWVAAQVSSTVPGATLEVFQVAQPAFTKLTDWWLLSEDTYLASLFGGHTAPQEDLFVQGHRYHACTEGLTVIEPMDGTASRVLFDLTYGARITL